MMAAGREMELEAYVLTDSLAMGGRGGAMAVVLGGKVRGRKRARISSVVFRMSSATLCCLVPSEDI